MGVDTKVLPGDITCSGRIAGPRECWRMSGLRSSLANV